MCCLMKQLEAHAKRCQWAGGAINSGWFRPLSESEFPWRCGLYSDYAKTMPYLFLKPHLSRAARTTTAVFRTLLVWVPLPPHCQYVEILMASAFSPFAMLKTAQVTVWYRTIHLSTHFYFIRICILPIAWRIRCMPRMVCLTWPLFCWLPGVACCISWRIQMGSKFFGTRSYLPTNFRGMPKSV